MFANVRLASCSLIVITAVVVTSLSAFADSTREQNKSRILATLQNAMNFGRPTQDGYATMWLADVNKYVECGSMFDYSLRCDAGGTVMEPSLEHVLTPERVGRLTALGWHLDPPVRILYP
jgi:hypothetical protein